MQNKINVTQESWVMEVSMLEFFEVKDKDFNLDLINLLEDALVHKIQA